MTSSSCGPETFGAKPANIKWNVVRGDTAELRIQFFENDEATAYDTSTWDFSASAYDYKNGVTDELQVVVGSGFVDVTASAEITSLWGEGYQRTVAELAFDLQVIINNTTTWTPVIGTISVLGDVTGGSL